MKVALLLALALVLSASLWAEDWTKHLVDNEGAVGEQCRMALDSQGNPHIVYLEGSAWDSLFYVYWTGAGWSNREYISKFASYPDITLDSSGQPHVAFRYSGSFHYTYYAHKSSGNWVLDQAFIAGSLYPRKGSAIALDSQGLPRIIHKQRAGNSNLLYHSYYDGSWNFDTVTSIEPGDWYSAAIDASDCVYVAYNTAAGHLRLAANCGSGWGSQYVDTASGVGVSSVG